MLILVGFERKPDLMLSGVIQPHAGVWIITVAMEISALYFWPNQLKISLQPLWAYVCKPILKVGHYSIATHHPFCTLDWDQIVLSLQSIVIYSFTQMFCHSIDMNFGKVLFCFYVLLSILGWIHDTWYFRDKWNKFYCQEVLLFTFTVTTYIAMTTGQKQ